MSINYHWYRFKYRFGKYLSLKTPVDISLELMSKCNMACSYCYHADQGSLPFKKGKMNTSLAMDIIRQGYELGVPSIKFNWKGESTLHPDYHFLTDFA